MTSVTQSIILCVTIVRIAKFVTMQPLPCVAITVALVLTNVEGVGCVLYADRRPRARIAANASVNLPCADTAKCAWSAPQRTRLTRTLENIYPSAASATGVLDVHSWLKWKVVIIPTLKRK